MAPKKAPKKKSPQASGDEYKKYKVGEIRKACKDLNAGCTSTTKKEEAIALILQALKDKTVTSAEVKKALAGGASTKKTVAAKKSTTAKKTTAKKTTAAKKSTSSSGRRSGILGMTVAQLRAYAKANGISLAGATTKAAIIAKIGSAEDDSGVDVIVVKTKKSVAPKKTKKSPASKKTGKSKKTITIDTWACGEDSNRCENEDEICDTDTGDCKGKKLKSGKGYDAATRKWLETRTKRDGYIFDEEAGLVGKKADVERYIKRWGPPTEGGDIVEEIEDVIPPKTKKTKKVLFVEEDEVSPPKTKKGKKGKKIVFEEDIEVETPSRNDCTGDYVCDDNQMCESYEEDGQVYGRCVGADDDYINKRRVTLEKDGKYFVGEEKLLRELQKRIGGNIRKPAPAKPAPPSGGVSGTKRDNMQSSIKAAFEACLGL